MPFGRQDAFWWDLVTVRDGRGLEDSLWLFPVVTATILYSLCSDRGGKANLCWRTIAIHRSLSPSAFNYFTMHVALHFHCAKCVFITALTLV